MPLRKILSHVIELVEENYDLKIGLLVCSSMEEAYFSHFNVTNRVPNILKLNITYTFVKLHFYKNADV